MMTTNVIRKNEFVPASAEAANEKSKLTLAVAKVSGTIWCSYHQGQANAETGAFLMRNCSGLICPDTSIGGKSTT